MALAIMVYSVKRGRLLIEAFEDLCDALQCVRRTPRKRGQAIRVYRDDGAILASTVTEEAYVGTTPYQHRKDVKRGQTYR